MTDHKQLPTRGSEPPESVRGQLSNELNELAIGAGDFYPAQRTSLVFQLRKIISLGGHFPSGVAFYAIGVLGSSVVACHGMSSDMASHEYMPVVATVMGSALVAQTVDALKKKS